MPSRSRRRESCRKESIPPVAHVTMNAATVSAARTLEVNRMRQMSQYPPSPQRFMATKAESKKEDRNGPRKTPQKQKMATLRRRSSRTGLPIKKRMLPAPMSASQELLINQQKIIVGGTLLCSCAARWAGNAASKTTHQTRTGVRRSAANRIAFGGQRTETGWGRKVSANPTFA